MPLPSDFKSCMKRIDINSLVRKNILNLKPYSSARDEFQGEAQVLLDANELPYDTGFNRYPDPRQRELRKAIAELKQVAPEQVFTGNGSDEAIDLLFRIFCIPGEDCVLIPQPTYGMYAVSADTNDIKTLTPPLTTDFDLDVDVILKAVTEKVKMIFLCSPNNPSGNLLSSSQVEKLMDQFEGIVVVDEAYIDFAPSKSWTTQLGSFNNLVILQTLSKAWGLAGLRLGMCFANEAVIRLMDKVKAPYNINQHSQEEALQRLKTGREQKEQWVRKIVNERQNLAAALRDCPGITKVFPSDANFLLVRMNNATGTYMRLVNEGIIVRDRSKVAQCEDCLRITVGTPEENRELMSALQRS